MTVLLRTSVDLDDVPVFDSWIFIPADGGERAPPLEPARARKNIAAALEQAFDDAAQDWWALGKELSADRSAEFAHTPACVANSSDFGLMLTWTRLVQGYAIEDGATLVVCDDPWLFRQLSLYPGVIAGVPPALLSRTPALWLRGLAARTAVAIRVACLAVSLRHQRKRAVRNQPSLLVYGHPASTSDGQDGYFGNLLQVQPTLSRVLHVDCKRDRARMLAEDGRTVSLHAFGSPLHALVLPFTRWRPSRRRLVGPHGWLVRRAVAREGSTGQAAMIRWQQQCQARWLRVCRPPVVSWPWENHSWERRFVRDAGALGVRTVGYQHSVIGRQMLNYAPASNPDGLESLPDLILCSGRATRDHLSRWGVPKARLGIGGALRFPNLRAPTRDRAAPIFMALPFDGITAAEMVAAARSAATRGYQFLIKGHPMTPFAIEEGPGMEPTARPLADHASLSAVIYAATTVGLEAILAGLPTFRFRPRDRIALDILPHGIDAPTVDSESLIEALAAPPSPPALDRNTIFGPVDMSLWQSALHPTQI